MSREAAFSALFAVVSAAYPWGVAATIAPHFDAALAKISAGSDQMSRLPLPEKSTANLR